MFMHQMKKYARLLLKFGVPLVAVAALIYWVSPRVFFMLVSAVGLVLMGLSALAMVLTFRKAKTVSPGSLFISIGISLISATVISSLSATSPGWLLPVMSLMFGVLMGSGWGLTTVVSAEGGAIRSRGSGWYLAVWILTMMITQLIPMLTGRTPSTGLILLFGGTGLVLGNSGVMLARYFSLKSRTNPIPERRVQ